MSSKMEKIEEQWPAITELMNESIRESVHENMAPCSKAEFLREYMRLDPEFERVLSQEFDDLLCGPEEA